MSKAQPMDVDARSRVYREQVGGGLVMTARQWRRWIKKARRAAVRKAMRDA